MIKVTDEAVEACARTYYENLGWDWASLDTEAREHDESKAIILEEFRQALEAAVPHLQVQARPMPTREAIEQRIRRIYIDGGAHITHAQEAAAEIAVAVLALLSPEETKCECEWTEDGPVPCDAHKGIVIPQATSAYSETVTLDVLLRLSENSTDGRLRDAIAMVRSALHDRVDALSTSGEVKP